MLEYKFNEKEVHIDDPQSDDKIKEMHFKIRVSIRKAIFI